MLEIVLEPGTTERELAQRYAAAVHQVMPLVGPMVLQMLSQHLRNMVQSEAVGAAERADGHAARARATRASRSPTSSASRAWARRSRPRTSARSPSGCSRSPREVVEPPVRLVKTIGDAVMLTSPTPAPLVRTALALVEATDAESEDGAFPQVRVGVALGPAVARGGDVFGRAVNLASRVTTIARAGSVLATARGARRGAPRSSAGPRRTRAGSRDCRIRCRCTVRGRPSRLRGRFLIDGTASSATGERRRRSTLIARQRLVDAERLADRAGDDHADRHHPRAGHVVVGRHARDATPRGCAPAATSPTA